MRWNFRSLLTNYRPTHLIEADDIKGRQHVV